MKMVRDAVGIGEVQWQRPEEPPMRVDCAVLQDPEKNKAMQEAVKKHVARLAGATCAGTNSAAK